MPQMFPQGSPQLSHVGGPVSQQMQVPQQPQMMQPNPHGLITTMTNPNQMAAPPGPPIAQVSGVIAQPTPYVSRSRIYAFVVDETGMPIELGSGRFAKAYLGEERWVESKTTLRRPSGPTGSQPVASRAAGRTTSSRRSPELVRYRPSP